jgi:hypothetical protein
MMMMMMMMMMMRIRRAAILKAKVVISYLYSSRHGRDFN